jgi:hypothetical protein
LTFTSFCDTIKRYGFNFMNPRKRQLGGPSSEDVSTSFATSPSSEAVGGDLGEKLAGRSSEQLTKRAGEVWSGIRETQRQRVEHRQFERKFGDPTSEAYQLAYEAAQVRLPLVADTGQGKKKLRPYYERAWREIALRTMETAWLGEATPPEPETDRNKGDFSREDLQKAAYASEIMIVGAPGAWKKAAQKNLQEMRDAVDTARRSLTEIQPANAVEPRAMSVRAAEVNLISRRTEWQDRRDEVARELASPTTSDTDKRRLQREDEQTKRKIARADTVLVWLRNKVATNPNATIDEVYGNAREEIKKSENHLTNRLIEAFEMRWGEELSALDILKEQLPRLAALVGDKIGQIDPDLQKNNYQEFQKRVQRGLAKARGFLVNWDNINSIQPRAGTEKLFKDRKSLMQVDWQRERLMETPLLQEMENAVTRVILEDLDLTAQREGGEIRAQNIVVGAEQENTEAYRRVAQERIERRASSKKKYGKWFPLFDPEFFTVSELRTPNEAALETSKAEEANPLLEELQQKIRQEAASDARVGFSIIEHSVAPSKENSKGEYWIFLRLYGGKILGEKDEHIPLTRTEIERLTTQDNSQEWKDARGTLHREVMARFEALRAKAELDKAGITFTGEEVAHRTDELTESILQEIIRRKRYGAHTEIAPEKTKEEFEKEILKDPEKYVQEMANVYGKLSEFIQKINIIDGIIQIGTTRLEQFVSDEERLLGAIQALIDRNAPLIAAKKKELKRHPAIIDTKQVLGALVVTFDSTTPILPDDFKNMEATDIRGFYKTTRDTAVPIIAIDKNTSKSGGMSAEDILRHELSHHAVAITDYLMTRDGLASGSRRGQVVALFGEEKNGGNKILETYKTDKEFYEKLLGRAFDEKKDPRRLYEQQGYLEEMAASLASGKFEWLNLDDQSLYSARNSEKRGMSEELVGDLEPDKKAVVALLRPFQSWFKLGQTMLPNLQIHKAEGQELWKQALSIVATARTVAQAKRAVEKLWNQSEFKKYLLDKNNLNDLKAFQREVDTQFP